MANRAIKGAMAKKACQNLLCNMIGCFLYMSRLGRFCYDLD